MTVDTEARRVRLWWLFISGRTIATGVFLILLAFLNGFATDNSLLPVFLLALFQFATNVGYVYLWKTRGITLLGYLAFSVEILMITGLIHLLGPGGWVFVLAYFWPIIVGGWLIGRRVILELTLLSGVCFTALILAQRNGFADPPVGMLFGGTPQALLLAYPYLAFIALLVWMMTREMESSQEELAESNAQLRRERNLLRGILASMTEAVCVVDAAGAVLMANRSAERLLGVRVGEPLPPWFADRVAAVSPQDPETPERLETERDDRVLSVSVAGLPLELDRSGGRLYVARDVTEQVHLERMKSDFVSYASHELRTPLTTIKMMVKLLLMDAAPGTRPHEYLRVVETQVNRQTRLVNNLLDFTRLEAGHYELEPEAVDPRQVLRSAAASCRPLAEEKGLHLELDVAGAPEGILSNASGLEQVLVNLLNNAVTFTDAGGRVSAACREEGGEVVFEVADTGIGMTKEQLGRIFTRFYSVRHPKKRSEGTGLGLVISKMIVEELGGRIEVASEEGTGTRFFVRLPARTPDAREGTQMTQTGTE